MITLNSFNTLPDQSDNLIGAVPLTSDSTQELLLRLTSAANQHCLVFDLDSTLLNNRPRNAAIMCEYGELHNEPLMLKASAEHFTDWSASNAMLAMGLPESKINSYIDGYQRFWSERFFSSEYCHYDIVIPGAPEFVSQVSAAGGDICYLTGRHEGMRLGTESSLSALGFPVPGQSGVRLLMKPNKEQSDDLFKVETLQGLEASKPVLAAFDNEPTHINSYRSAFPNAACIHLLTDHSMREVKLLNNIYSILNFIR